MKNSLPLTGQTHDVLNPDQECSIIDQMLCEQARPEDGLRKLELSRQMTSIRAKWQAQMSLYRTLGDTYLASIRCDAHLA